MTKLCVVGSVDMGQIHIYPACYGLCPRNFILQFISHTLNWSCSCNM